MQPSYNVIYFSTELDFPKTNIYPHCQQSSVHFLEEIYETGNK